MPDGQLEQSLALYDYYCSPCMLSIYSKVLVDGINLTSFE